MHISQLKSLRPPDKLQPQAVVARITFFLLANIGHCIQTVNTQLLSGAKRLQS